MHQLPSGGRLDYTTSAPDEKALEVYRGSLGGTNYKRSDYHPTEEFTLTLSLIITVTLALTLRLTLPLSPSLSSLEPQCYVLPFGIWYWTRPSPDSAGDTMASTT